MRWWPMPRFLKNINLDTMQQTQLAGTSRLCGRRFRLDLGRGSAGTDGHRYVLYQRSRSDGGNGDAGTVGDGDAEPDGNRPRRPRRPRGRPRKPLRLGKQQKRRRPRSLRRRKPQRLGPRQHIRRPSGRREQTKATNKQEQKNRAKKALFYVVGGCLY